MGSGVPGCELGRYGFKVQGWVDHFETWRRDLLKRIKAESDAPVDYLIGAELVADAAERAAGGDAVWLRERAAVLRSGKETKALRIHATDPMLHELVLAILTSDLQRSRIANLTLLLIRCVRDSVHGTSFFRAPRQQSQAITAHSPIAKAAAIHRRDGFQCRVRAADSSHRHALSQRAATTHPEAQPGDCGSPWAIGAEEGGHKEIHNELGTSRRFQAIR